MITMMVGNEDRHGDGEYDGERDHIEKHCGVRMILMRIAGWGVVPRMAPPPSQGGST